MGAFTTKDFEQNFKLLYRPLCLFALRYTEDIDEAEDVVQQAFTDVWDKKTALESIGNFKAYMYRAVRNRSLNFVSKQVVEQPAAQLPDCEDESEEEQMRISERDARLWKVIDELPPERKKIFLMSKRDGLKYQEIAEELKISIKTVENQMGKALKSLRETAVRIYTFFFGVA